MRLTLRSHSALWRGERFGRHEASSGRWRFLDGSSTTWSTVSRIKPERRTVQRSYVEVALGGHYDRST